MNSAVPARFVQLRCGPSEQPIWFNVAEIAAVAVPGEDLQPAVMLTNGHEFCVSVVEDTKKLLDILRRLEAT